MIWPTSVLGAAGAAGQCRTFLLKRCWAILFGQIKSKLITQVDLDIMNLNPTINVLGLRLIKEFLEFEESLISMQDLDCFYAR